MRRSDRSPRTLRMRLEASLGCRFCSNLAVGLDLEFCLVLGFCLVLSGEEVAWFLRDRRRERRIERKWRGEKRDTRGDEGERSRER